jgi:putative ABC transport system substrate-binding protein
MPVIAYLSSRSAESDALMVVAFRRGLSEAGYVEGRNLTIEYRFADGLYDRQVELTADLIRRKMIVIVFAGFGGTTPAAALQQLRASQIPVVFNTGTDPVRLGMVASISRPGGNFTGIYTLITELTGKNIGLLRELLPNPKTIALFLDRRTSRATIANANEAAATIGLQLKVLDVATESEIDAAFATLGRDRVDAIFVATSPFLVTQAQQLAALAAHHRIPAIYARREFARAGGLMSYGYDVADGYRHMGLYAGRILKGEKPADLPVVQPTKFELVINMKTAKALGLEIPAKVLALADEVIE